MLRTEVSIGDIIVVVGMVGTVLYQYFGTVRQVDRIAERVKATDTKVEELRRGRGLIMESWPMGFQRCMGFLNGHFPR
jgi:hypothetical protein